MWIIFDLFIAFLQLFVDLFQYYLHISSICFLLLEEIQMLSEMLKRHLNIDQQFISLFTFSFHPLNLTLNLGEPCLFLHNFPHFHLLKLPLILRFVQSLLQKLLLCAQIFNYCLISLS